MTRRKILTLFGMAPALQVPLKAVEPKAKALADVWVSKPLRPSYKDYAEFSVRIPVRPTKGGKFSMLSETPRKMASTIHQRFLHDFDARLKQIQEAI